MRVFSEYTKLTEQSSLLSKDIKKDLLTIDDYFNTGDYNDMASLSSSGSSNNIILTNNDEL